MAEYQLTFPGGDERIQSHLTMFKALWKKLVMFVDWIHSIGRRWRICVEWPKGCAYWNWKDVRSFLATWDLQEVCFDGCAIGLKARSGDFLKKPWRVCTNDQNILSALRGLTCSNTGNVLTERAHAECRGIDCKNFENILQPLTITLTQLFPFVQRLVRTHMNYSRHAVLIVHVFVLLNSKLI